MLTVSQRIAFYIRMLVKVGIFRAGGYRPVEILPVPGSHLRNQQAVPYTGAIPHTKTNAFVCLIVHTVQEIA
jgi:hypothetical protein